MIVKFPVKRSWKNNSMMLLIRSTSFEFYFSLFWWANNKINARRNLLPGSNKGITPFLTIMYILTIYYQTISCHMPYKIIHNYMNPSESTYLPQGWTTNTNRYCIFKLTHQEFNILALISAGPWKANLTIVSQGLEHRTPGLGILST